MFYIIHLRRLMKVSPFKSLEDLLTKHISENMARRAEATSTLSLSQIAQIVTNLEYFEVACSELERSLTNIRCAHIKCSVVPVY